MATSEDYNNIVEERRNKLKNRQKSVDNWVKSKAGDGALIGVFVGRILGYVIGGILGAVTLVFAGGNEDLGFLSFYVGSFVGEAVGVVLGLAIGSTIGLLYGKSKKIEKEISLEKKDIQDEKQQLLALEKSDKGSNVALVVDNTKTEQNSAASEYNKTDDKKNKTIVKNNIKTVTTHNNPHVERYLKGKHNKDKPLSVA